MHIRSSAGGKYPLCPLNSKLVFQELPILAPSLALVEFFSLMTSSPLQSYPRLREAKIRKHQQMLWGQVTLSAAGCPVP